MITKDFSWQMHDYEIIKSALDNRILLVTANDFDSKYNSIHRYCASLDCENYKVFNITGSFHSYKRSLIPFLESVVSSLEYRKDFNLRDMSKNVFKDITQSEAITYLIESLKLGQEYEASGLLTDLENNILTEMQKLSTNKTAIFNFQYAHLYDTDSKTLLDLLLSEKLIQYYPFLKTAKFIFLDNDFAEQYYRDIQIYEHKHIFLYTPTNEDSSEIVGFLYEENKDETFAADLFTLCGGKISKLELVCQYLKKSAVSEFDIYNNDFKSIVFNVLEKRLHELSARKPLVNEVLKIASEIEDVEGFFTVEELDWIFNQQRDKIQDIIEYSNRELLTISQNNYSKFAHKIVLEFFLQLPLANKQRANMQIAKTIRIYNPGDYFCLYHYYAKAEMYNDASVAFIQYYLQKKMERPNSSWKNEAKMIELLKSKGYDCYCDLIDRFYKYYIDLNYDAAFNCMEEALTVPDETIYLEILYLRSITLRKIGTTKDYLKEALDDMILIEERAKDLDLDLWTRAASTLISYYVNFEGDILKAKTIFKKLNLYYRQNKLESIIIKKGMYSLYRKSSALHSPEHAINMIEESLRFFETSNYRLEYLMALNNYGATLLVLGEFDKAWIAMNKTMHIINELPYSSINKYYILNNYIVSSVLSQKQPVSIFTEIFEQKINMIKDYEVKIIPLITLGVLYALNNQLKKAEDILNTAVKISELIDDDYYIYANLSSVKYLRHDGEAFRIFCKHCSKAPKLTPTTLRHLYDRRYENFKQLFKTNRQMGPSELDTLFLDKDRPECSWNFIGRGFLFSDLQFWSEH